MKNNYLLIALTLFGCLSFSLRAQTQKEITCEADKIITPESSRTILSRTNANSRLFSIQDKRCIAISIETLGGTNDDQDIPLLLKFLSFARPNESESIVTMQPRSPDYYYPAIAALSEHHEAARVALMNQVERSDLDEITRRNGIAALLRIRATNPESVILELRGRKEKVDANTRTNLGLAISDALENFRCKAEQAKCLFAANSANVN